MELLSNGASPRQWLSTPFGGLYNFGWFEATPIFGNLHQTRSQHVERSRPSTKHLVAAVSASPAASTSGRFSGTMDIYGQSKVLKMMIMYDDI